jgi:hypothetical protein
MKKILALIWGLITGTVLLTLQGTASAIGNNSSIMTNITNATAALGNMSNLGAN